MRIDDSLDLFAEHAVGQSLSLRTFPRGSIDVLIKFYRWYHRIALERFICQELYYSS